MNENIIKIEIDSKFMCDCKLPLASVTFHNDLEARRQNSLILFMDPLPPPPLFKPDHFYIYTSKAFCKQRRHSP